jgi:MFS transporter, SP family, general alpha glucoside:H+ symporter
VGHTKSLREQFLWLFRYFPLLLLLLYQRQEVDLTPQPAYFLEQAGLAPSKAIDFALGQYGINMAGVFGAWGLMTLGIGRRSLYLYGLCGLCTMLLIMGFLGIPSDRNAASLATGSIMLVWALCYQLSVGT